MLKELETYSKFHSPSYVIEIYHEKNTQEIIYGNREVTPTIKKSNHDTLYDIASLTKLYTATLVYIAYEEKKLDLYAKVNLIDNRFSHLQDVRIIDLLSHNQEIWTDGYLADAKSREEFYQILFSSTVKSHVPTYVDTHYIILSTILEKIYQLPYETLLKNKIFIPLNLKKTTVDPLGDNIASNNYEKLNDTIVDNTYPGIVHDKKARRAKELGVITGHASIFTTGSELLDFLKSFLDYSLLKPDTISLMLKHTDRNEMNYQLLSNFHNCQDKDINLMYQLALEQNENFKAIHTYNYMGTRYYNQIEALNDVPKYCSANTIVFSGYTGPMFLIDFDKFIIIVIMCNVIHNTKISRIERKDGTKHLMDIICHNLYK